MSFLLVFSIKQITWYYEQLTIFVIMAVYLITSGIKSFTVDLDTEQVIVETTLSTSQVQKMIENSGRMAILRGLGAAGI